VCVLARDNICIYIYNIHKYILQYIYKGGEGKE